MIVFNNWCKFMLVFQSFSEFQKNLIWPIKFKSTISAKIYFRETLQGLCVQIDNTCNFWQSYYRFQKNNYMRKKLLQLQGIVNLIELLSYILYLIYLLYFISTTQQSAAATTGRCFANFFFFQNLKIRAIIWFKNKLATVHVFL